MKRLLYKGLQLFVNRIANGLVTGKRMVGTSMVLHYEIPQYLGFLFQKEITYEKTLQKKLLPHISSDNLIFDIGSNIGQYALWFSTVAQKGKVICYEPDKKNYAFLTFNVLINEISNIEINNIGLSDKISRQKFYRDTKTGGRSGSLGKEFVGDSFQGSIQDVELSTLDTQIKKYGVPDFIKIDVEGFEYQVLKGLKEPCKTTVYFIEVRDLSSTQVFDYFSKYNFSCTMLDSNPSREINKAEEIPGFCNLLFKYNKFQSI